jgi:hypothetical protein
MEMPQQNYLCRYLKQKCLFFFFYFFSYTKLENRRAEQILPLGWGWGDAVSTNATGEEVGKF